MKRRPIAGVAVLLMAVTTACSTETGSAPAASPTSSPSRSASVPSTLDSQLIAAAWKNDVAEAKRLITAGANVNAVDNTVQSAFLIAASEGDLELLDLTLAHGADVRSLDSYDGTALIRAAERGHAAVVGRLLKAGVAVNHVNNLGWTALHEAVILGKGTPAYVDTVRLLIAGGADRTKPAVNDGATPVQAAKDRGQTAVSAALDTAGELRDTRAATEALLAAAASGDANKVAAALAAGAPIESRDDHRRTALLLASLNDRVEVARLLVALGADPDAQDDRQDSAWLVTGVTGSVAMLETLLPANPDLTLRNRFGGISVIPASERGHVDYVRRVVKTKININHVNNLGWTALLEAIILGKGTQQWQDIVKILIEAGANPNLPDAEGVTPLHHANSKGHKEIAKTLRTAGAR